MGRLHLTNGGAGRHFLDVPLANASYYAAASAAAAPTPLSIPALHITTTGRESTRVQLQKQRLRDQHHATVVVSQRIPGLKTSAAFFASLRTNLHLNASPPSSPISTPPSMSASTASLPPPSPLSSITMEQPDSIPTAPDDHNNQTPLTGEDPLAGVPELKTYAAESEDDKIDALRLIADGVAQMRQKANSALLFHPLNLAVAVATLAMVARYLLEAGRELTMVATTCTGLTMVWLVFCRWLTQPYLNAAEEVSWAWLGAADVFVTKFGEEVIGTVVVEWISGESRQKRKKPQRGEIKAWAVRLKYRKKGVGAALLEVAVQESKKKGVETLEFADEHANSLRVLPGLYNGVFEAREKKARELLLDLLAMSPSRSKRK